MIRSVATHWLRRPTPLPVVFDDGHVEDLGARIFTQARRM
jgi:hypothetical protein